MKLEKRAFTLIELILVVAIVAVAIVPVITSARQKARVAKLLQFVETLKTASRLYNSDTGRYAGDLTDVAFERQGLSQNDRSPGWDGPYIPRLLTNEDAYPGNRLDFFSEMITDFDLDGDGTTDKRFGTEGNSIVLRGFSESYAKCINDVLDKNIPGDWMTTGKIRFRSDLNRAYIYLIGGS